MPSACRSRPPMTERHDPVSVQVNPPHDHLNTEDRRVERHGQVVLDHRVQGGELLIIAISIHHRLGHQLIKRGTAELTHGEQPNGQLAPTSVHGGVGA